MAADKGTGGRAYAQARAEAERRRRERALAASAPRDTRTVSDVRTETRALERGKRDFPTVRPLPVAPDPNSSVGRVIASRERQRQRDISRPPAGRGGLGAYAEGVARVGLAPLPSAFLFGNPEVGQGFRDTRDFARSAKDILLSPGASKREKVEAALGTIAVGGAIGGLGGPTPRKPPRTRDFRAGDLTVSIPAAKSRAGRLTERLLDASRPVTGKTPLVRTEVEKAGAELGRTVALKSKLETAPAEALRRVGRRLNPAQDYTLRVLAEQATIAERIALHEGQAASQTGLNRLFHETHLQLLKGASRYVDESSGVPVLRAGAPPKLKQAYGLLLDVDKQTGTILKDIGKLSDETIRERISAPGRAFKGATFSEAEGKFVGEGAEFTGGEAFVSYARGIPGAGLRAYARATAQMFGGGGRRTIGAGASDAYLKKQFRGKSILSGRFRTDTPNVSADQLVKAARLSAARLARTEFRAASTDVPRSLSDIAIREDFLLGKSIPDDLRKVWEAMDAAEAGGRKLGLYEMDAIEGRTIARMNDWIFPSEVADDAIEAIPGVKWLPAGLAHESRLFDVPAANKMAMQAWGKFARAAGTVGGVSLDLANVMLKAATLWLNPSYGPIQLTQNAIRLLSEEGPLALARIPQAWTLSKKLGAVDLAKVDSLMQMDVLVKARSDRLVGKVVEPMAKFWTIFADLGPRRAAFLNVAAKAGYDSPAKLGQLLNDKTAFTDLEQITRRSLDVMGDFERMNGFEKTVMSRVFWFWPWTHVAWRMSARFPIDHPWQAAALTYAAYEGKQYADDKLGERPWYAQTYLPVGDGKVNVGPLFPQGTVLGQAQTAAGFLGLTQDGPKAADSFVPSLSAFGEAAYGVDSFTGQPVEGGLPGALKRQALGIPAVRKFNDLTRSDKEIAADQGKKLTPRSKLQAWLAVPGGSLAPTGYNRDVGEAIVRRKKESHGQGPKLRYQDALKDIATGVRKGELTDDEATEFKSRARATYEGEQREKELKKRGLDEADLNRQLVIDDGVRQGDSLADVNEFLELAGYPPVTAAELEKAERELLKLDVAVGH